MLDVGFADVPQRRSFDPRFQECCRRSKMNHIVWRFSVEMRTRSEMLVEKGPKRNAAVMVFYGESDRRGLIGKGQQH